jgi:hypothetical protein
MIFCPRQRQPRHLLLRDETLEESDNLPILMFSPRKPSKTSKPPWVLVRSMELFDTCAISTEIVDRVTTETFAALLLGGHV